MLYNISTIFTIEYHFIAKSMITISSSIYIIFIVTSIHEDWQMISRCWQIDISDDDDSKFNEILKAVLKLQEIVLKIQL